MRWFDLRLLFPLRFSLSFFFTSLIPHYFPKRVVSSSQFSQDFPSFGAESPAPQGPLHPKPTRTMSQAHLLLSCNVLVWVPPPQSKPWDKGSSTSSLCWRWSQETPAGLWRSESGRERQSVQDAFKDALSSRILLSATELNPSRDRWAITWGAHLRVISPEGWGNQGKCPPSSGFGKVCSKKHFPPGTSHPPCARPGRLVAAAGH